MRAPATVAGHRAAAGGGVGAEPGPDFARTRPVRLNQLELHIVGLAFAYFTGVEQSTDSVPNTVGAAYSRLKPLVVGVFGSS